MNLAISIFVAGVLVLGATSGSAQDTTGPGAAAQTSPSATPTPPTGGTTATPSEPAGATAPAAGHIPAAPAGKSQVVFFRTGAYMGAATWFKIRENGAELGKLSNQSYFVAVLDPGPHAFTATTESKNTLKLELEDGETTYVRGTLQMGLILYEPNLAPVDQAMFEKHYAHLHAVKSQADSEPKASETPKEPDKAPQ